MENIQVFYEVIEPETETTQVFPAGVIADPQQIASIVEVMMGGDGNDDDNNENGYTPFVFNPDSFYIVAGPELSVLTH